VFLHNQSMAPSSPPSHATIQTGQIPRVHGATGDDGEIAEDAPVLAAIAGRAGLFTAFVGNNDFAMTRLRGPGGWDVFETPFYKHGKDCAPMIARGVELAKQAATEKKRFFLSMLPIEPHVAYRFHDGVTDKYFAGPWAKPFGKRVTSAHLTRIRKMHMTDAQWAQVRALYDGEVTHVDQCLAALEDGLRAAGVLDRTAIIVASDHGEGLGERGTNTGHAYGLTRELVDTPLVIVGGVAAGARVTAASSNADIAPTVLDLLGLPADARMQGQSLVGDTLAPPLPRVVASEYGKSYALRSTRWHLVVGYSGKAELFDPTTDPAEATDRSGDAAAAIPLRYLRDAAGLYLAHREQWHAATWGAWNDLARGNPLAK
jgi:arylsulfatase A-like enzyme